jgi:hypothetical protein
MTLEQSIQFHRDEAARFLGAADDWRDKGNAGWELVCLYQAVQQTLSVAVSAFDSASSGIAYLVDRRAAVFDRTFRLARYVHAIDHAPRDAPPAGIGSLILCVHSAWLLSADSDARDLAAVCGDVDRLRRFQVFGLWRDFARGIAAVAARAPFAPADRTYKGYDRHWAIYLRLMADICAGNDLGPVCALVDRSFAERNRDKRLVCDAPDGNGVFPVKWDFRKHSLLQAALAENYPGAAPDRSPAL